MDSPSISEQAERPYISTGHLPEPEMVQRPVDDAHKRFRSNSDEHNGRGMTAAPRATAAIVLVPVEN